jgi:hypothetical protein
MIEIYITENNHQSIIIWKLINEITIFKEEWVKDPPHVLYFDVPQPPVSATHTRFHMRSRMVCAVEELLS